MNTEVIKELKGIFEKILEMVEEEMGDNKSLHGICKTISLYDLSAIHELCGNMEEGLAVDEDYLSFVDKLYLERIAVQFEINSYHELAVLGIEAGEILRNEIFSREI